LKHDQQFDMKMKQIQNGEVGGTMRFAVGECSLGAVLVAASEKGVCAVFLGDSPDALVQELEGRFPRAFLVGGDEALKGVVCQVAEFIDNPRDSLGLTLDVQGTTFQQKVWQQLREIPFGSTRSYADVAEAIGHPQAVRAVAAACASNKVAVAIPCHRVVRSDGSLSGYRWGTGRKAKLLEAERRSRAIAATGS
jgi:AraC family transcriptional regulator of adaptative response/methylated-DNA-[protein]-cysteine methyltransferase